MTVQDQVLRKFMEGNQSLKKRLKAVYLFGSRARGDERPDSDYDLLVVTSKDFSLSDKGKLYDRVVDLLLETGRLISLKIFKEKEFQRLSDLKTPFVQRVLQEGIRVG